MAAELDIGPLSWVKDEIDLALGRSAEALTRLAADPADSASLQAARDELHQAHGALAIVGLPGLTEFSAALENLLGDVAAGGIAFGNEVAAAAQAGIGAIRHYLDDLVAGVSDQALRLYPAYRAMALARGKGAPSPAELFHPDLTLRPPRREKEPPPLADDARTARLRAARLGFQRGLLKWLKRDTRGAVEMRNSLAVVEAAQATPAARCFWWVALAFLDAIAADAVTLDGSGRKLGSRIDAQLGKLVEGGAIDGERTQREMLYWIALSAPGGAQREAVRALYRLPELLPAAESRSEAERRQAIRAARDELTAAIDAWGRHCAGSDPALPSFVARATALATAIGGVDAPPLGRVCEALAAFADDLPAGAANRDGSIAIEVATALLFVEHGLDNLQDSNGDDFARQASVVATRIEALARGAALAAHDIPRLDALVRTAQERLLTKQVAKEIAACLAQVEAELDPFFRDPSQRSALPALSKPLRQVSGALRMLGEDRAAEVAEEVGGHVERFSGKSYVAALEDFERTAKLVSALGFFAERLQSGSPDIDILLGNKPLETPAAEPTVETADTSATATSSAPAAEPEPVPAVQPEPEPTAPTLKLVHSAPADEPVAFVPPEGIAVGERILAPALYEIYRDEARSHVATLQATLGLQTVPPFEAVRAAHTLGSISASAGFVAVERLARALERALSRLSAAGAIADEHWRMLLARVTGALEGMVGAIADRREPAPEAALENELDALTLPAAPPHVSVLDGQGDNERRAARLADEVDAELLPIFLEEGAELMPEIDAKLRDWQAAPAGAGPADRLKRLLHTFKGSARMAGAMGIGELAHAMESRIERAAAMNAATPAFIDELIASWDRVTLLVAELACPPAAVAAAGVPDTTAEPAPAAPPASADEPLTVDIALIPAADATEPAAESAARPMLRIRAEAVDRLVNETGEMSIARSRAEGELRTLKAALVDLTDNVIRLRTQLREIEQQAEAQIPSGQTDDGRPFDPLELDRYTRFQELTRMMAESVNDVAAIQHQLLKNVDHAGVALAEQARLNRDVSQSLMSVRMVPFASVADRLHRVVRQSAKDLGRRANLDLRGGRTEIDRSVLERMIGPLEHLLRNAVAHGIETPETRAAAGKSETGEIVLTLAQEGNEILLALADDGAGIDLARVRRRAEERGLLTGAELDDERALTQLIFAAGFSTAEAVSAVAGRGVGMDVVREETTALGGRIEVENRPGRGATFRIWLPLTLAVTQAVLVRAAGRSFAIPSTMVEQAAELKPDAAAELRAAGHTEWLGNRYVWHYLPRLLGDTQAAPVAARRHWMLLVKGGTRRLALEVDSMVGNEEIVVKNIGAQLARVAGIAGATVLGDGEIALIVNPVALAQRARPREGATTTVLALQRRAAATVMIVDDSLTVRKATSRLLGREGYEVMTAKDGADALEQIADLLPDLVVADIEMPNMDGFELIRHLRADERTQRLPVIVVTSRTADKHRRHAEELGADRYFGKPYDETELLRTIRELLAARN